MEDCCFITASDEQQNVEEATTSSTVDEKPAEEVKKSQPKQQHKARRLGKRSRNPYLMFLRDYRAQHFGLNAIQMVKEGAKEWNQLSIENKFKYYKSAHQVPRTPQNSKKIRKRSRSRARSQSRSREVSRSKSQLRRATSYIS